MSQLKVQNTTAMEWEGELDDADLIAVTGGGIVDTAVGGVTSANNAIGNGGRPTTGALDLIFTTVDNTAGYGKQVSGGVEGGFQAVNATLTATGSQV
ncbi:MAG: hypothetical protein PUP93_17175 [Rhizonema sp. NSF051]|nr:hypothetical protein [Rhizonema sp. NSF051]